MESSNTLILADESADWKIAGLPQLERIALAAQEFVTRNGQTSVGICIFWRPDLAPRQRRQLDHRRLQGVTVTTTSDNFVRNNERFDLVFSTRFVPRRNWWRSCSAPLATARLWQRSESDLDKLWSDGFRTCEAAFKAAEANRDGCAYLLDRTNIAGAEMLLLRASGKTDDGLVSRFLNRPISHRLTRLLLKLPITPNAWSLWILVLPLLGFSFLLRGDYAGFVIGAAFYQLHSILDGCDGEIARAKYLDSQKGPGLDALGDLAAILLFALGLGIGLFRQGIGNPGTRLLYLSEGVLSFLLIATRLGPHAFDLLTRGTTAVLSSEHDRLLRDSGNRMLGARLTSFVFQVTKRDVAFFFFLLLAIVGRPLWVLHVLFIYSLGTFLVLLQGRTMRRTGRDRPSLASTDLR